MVKTRAIDIDCPIPKRTETVAICGVTGTRSVGCGAVAGEYCGSYGVGTDLCQARISAAAAKTRAANRARRP